MPAIRWTSNDQHEFLTSEIPAFLNARRDNNVRNYLLDVGNRFFAIWPSGDAESIKKRRTQIRTWLYWVARKGNRRSGLANLGLLLKLLKKSQGRSLQEQEVYQKIFNDKIKPIYEKRVGEAGAKTSTERMKVRREVVSELWREEDAEVVAEIKAECKKLRNSKKEADHSMKPTTKGDDRKPEEFHHAISAFPSMLQALMETLAEATGWVIFVSAGGPSPIDNGNICMEHHYFGRKNSSGQEFPDAYLGFEKGYEVPLGEFIHGCFPSDVRDGRALHQDAVDYLMGDEPPAQNVAVKRQPTKKAVSSRPTVDREPPTPAASGLFSDEGEGNSNDSDDEPEDAEDEDPTPAPPNQETVPLNKRTAESQRDPNDETMPDVSPRRSRARQARQIIDDTHDDVPTPLVPTGSTEAEAPTGRSTSLPHVTSTKSPSKSRKNNKGNDGTQDKSRSPSSTSTSTPAQSPQPTIASSTTNTQASAHFPSVDSPSPSTPSRKRQDDRNTGSTGRKSSNTGNAKDIRPSLSSASNLQDSPQEQGEEVNSCGAHTTDSIPSRASQVPASTPQAPTSLPPTPQHPTPRTPSHNGLPPSLVDPAADSVSEDQAAQDYTIPGATVDSPLASRQGKNRPKGSMKPKKKAAPKQKKAVPVQEESRVILGKRERRAAKNANGEDAYQAPSKKRRGS